MRLIKEWLGLKVVWDKGCTRNMETLFRKGVTKACLQLAAEETRKGVWGQKAEWVLTSLHQQAFMEILHWVRTHLLEEVWESNQAMGAYRMLQEAA